MKEGKKKFAFGISLNKKKKKPPEDANTLQHYMALLLEDIRDGKKNATRPNGFFKHEG